SAAWAWGGEGEGDAPEAPPYPSTPLTGVQSSSPDFQPGDPNQARVKELIEVAINLRQLCRGPRDGDLLGQDNEGEEVRVVSADWTPTCATYCGPSARIDVCAFEDPALARAAVAVATRDVLAVVEQLEPIRRT